ncbi:MAG: hypothetical protein LUQ59_12420 [Methanothrix sp.]|nr:hypothetical protein [Methanothrix sp.]
MTTGGAAYCWGSGISGELGNGDMSHFWSIPVAVVDGHTYSTIAAAQGHTCAVATDGAGFCWGDDGYGQLGGDFSGSPSRPSSCVGAARPCRVKGF